MKYDPLSRGLILWYLLWTAALPGQTTFQKYYGDGIVSQHADCIVATADGVILAGTSVNTNPNYRLFFMKIGLDGKLLWMKYYANPGFQLAFADLIEANDGGFLAVGTDPEGISTTLLIKTDAQGGLEWQKKIHSYASNRNDGGYKLCRTDGGYIVSGYSKRGDTHPTLTRIDNMGATLWSKRYVAQSFDNPRMFACMVSGDTIFACGSKDSVATYNLFNAVTGDTLYSQWFSAAGSNFSKSLTSMAPAPDGDLLLCGFIETGKLPGDPAQGNSGFHVWVCRISRSGQLRWSKVYSGYTVSGYNLNGDGKIVPLGSDRYLLINRDYLGEPILTQINSAGEVQWAYDYGYKDHKQVFFSATSAPDGGLIAIGGALLLGGKQEQIIAVKTDANGIVESCCTQPVQITATSYPVQTIVESLHRQFDFDPTADWSIDANPDSLVSGNFCPPQHRTVDVPLCPGDTLVIDGVAYTNAGIVSTTVPGPKCDTVLTYRIIPGIPPARSETLYFCPGDTLTLYGKSYTQPGVYAQTVPSVLGLCDTIYTYTLLLQTDTAVGSLSLTCPDDLSVQLPFGTLSTPVAFSAPVGYSSCPCPGVASEQTAGLPSGSAFLLGVHTLCYRALDRCGNEATCCFQIHVEEDAAAPCDVKTNGCIRFELLRLTADIQGRRTYHFRVQNNCAQALQYVAFQLPQGVAAVAPGPSYITPGGRIYSILNPNFSPEYSIRFKTQGQGISSGASDEFSFMLPPYSAPDYIHTVVKLEGQVFVEAHLNTFNCPVEPQVQSRAAGEETNLERLAVFPNPTTREIWATWRGGQVSPVRIRVFNAQGELLYTGETGAGQFRLDFEWPAGVYFLEAVAPDNRNRQTVRFVVL